MKLKRFFRVSLLILASLLVVISVFAQFGMKMRKSDKEALETFGIAHVPLEFRTVGTGDNVVHYAVTGSDTLPTLLFIHGSPGSWDAFEGYLLDADLRKKFRIISLDRPGFGYSNFGEARSLRENTALCYQVYQAEYMGKPIHIIGHSIGGPVVLDLAQIHPEAFASISILAGSISGKYEAPEKWRLPFVAVPLRFLVPGALRVSNDEIWMFKKELAGLDSGYGNLQMPVYFIHGDADPLVPVGNAYFGMEKLEGSSLGHIEIIEGANHFIPWEHFDLIKKHLLQL